MEDATATAMATAPPTSGPPEGPARATARSEDGYVYDVETGEVLDWEPAESPAGEPFAVRDASGADWVLELIGRAEAQVLAVEAEERSILANLGRRKGWHLAVIRFLRWRFGRQLEDQARRDLEAAGNRRKTMVYPHGEVTFRRTAGSVAITDPGAATRFALEWKPEAVKYSVGATGLKEAIEAYRAANGEEPEVEGFCLIKGPAESVTIKTGIGKESD